LVQNYLYQKQRYSININISTYAKLQINIQLAKKKIV